MLAIACAGPEARPTPVEVVVARPSAPSPRPAVLATAPDATPDEPIVVAWVRDERVARERAARDGVPLVVFVCAEWSAASVTVERTVFADPEVTRLSRSFVMLRLDVTAAEGDAELYADRYAVRQLPAVAIFDPDGTRLHYLEGPIDAPSVVAMMRASAP